MRDALHFSTDDRVLLVLPLHHAMPFIATIVLPALVGAHFVIENDLRRVRDRLQEYKPTIFFGVPALYELMYRNLLARAEAEGRLHTLQAWQKRLGADQAPDRRQPRPAALPADPQGARRQAALPGQRRRGPQPADRSATSSASACRCSRAGA